MEPSQVTERLARCRYCRKEVPSDTSLAFFQNREGGDAGRCRDCNQRRFDFIHTSGDPVTARLHDFVAQSACDTDSWYCGCRGWD